jgi:hypothetical protein
MVKDETVLVGRSQGKPCCGQLSRADVVKSVRSHRNAEVIGGIVNPLIAVANGTVRLGHLGEKNRSEKKG